MMGVFGSIQLTAIVATMAFLFGGSSGFWLCHWWYKTDELKAEVARLERNFETLRHMVGVSNELDLEAMTVEQVNQEIENAILARAHALKRDDDPVCFDTEFLRDVAKLQ